MARDTRQRQRQLRTLAFMGFVKVVGSVHADEEPSEGGGGEEEPGATPLTMDRTDITMDRTDITFDMTEL